MLETLQKPCQARFRQNLLFLPAIDGVPAGSEKNRPGAVAKLSSEESDSPDAAQEDPT
jgi:hypothetical protein